VDAEDIRLLPIVRSQIGLKTLRSGRASWLGHWCSWPRRSWSQDHK